MLRAERQNQIVDIINQKGIVTIEELMERVNISKATTRRDINALSDEKRIVKIRGGAQSIIASAPFEPSLFARSLVNADEKKRIAMEAVKYIQPEDRVILDSGTTVLEVARLLSSFTSLTVVTNDIHIAAEINTNTTNHLFFIGGIIRQGFCSSYGFYAESMLKSLSVDKIFLSVDAIDPDLGIMSYTMDDINLKSIGIDKAKEVFLLCDHSKFCTQALFSVGMMDKITTIISGRELDPAVSEKLRSNGKSIILV